MSYELAKEDRGVCVTMHGVVDVEEAIAAIGEVATVDPDREGAYLVVDMTDVARLDMEVADLHRLALAVRMAYPRGNDFRLAYIAPGGAVASVVELFRDVRDLLTGQQPEALAPMRVFDDIDEGRSWASAVGSGEDK